MIQVSKLAYLPTYLLTYLLTCLFTYLPTYLFLLSSSTKWNETYVQDQHM